MHPELSSQVTPRHQSCRLFLCWGLTVATHALAAGLGIRYLVLAGTGSVWSLSDVELYFNWAKLIERGQWPYRDFVVEYPPLAVPFFVTPLLFRSLMPHWYVRPEGYLGAFVVEMILIDAVVIWVIARQVKQTRGLSHVPGCLGWYTAFFVVMCPFNVTRFDLSPTLIAFIATVAFERGRPRMGGLWSAIGTLIKIVPGLVLLPWIAGPKSRQARVDAITSYSLLLAAACTAWFLLGWEKTWQSISYHLQRGIEVGTSYASVYMIAQRWFHFRMHLYYSFGSVNLSGPGVNLLCSLTVLVQFGLFWLIWRRAQRMRQPYSIQLAAAMLLGYMIGGKVFSPQYMIWLTPFAAVIQRGRWLFLCCCILTTLIYPWTYHALINFELIPSILLLMRNLGLIWLFFMWLQRDDDRNASETARIILAVN